MNNTPIPVIGLIHVANADLVHPREQLARLLGDPLPADWADPQAVAARQERLATVAAHVAHAVVEGLLHFRDVATRGVPACEGDAQVAALTSALVGLHRAWGTYTHGTQRADAPEIVMAGAERECGAAVAAVLLGLLERLGSDLARGSVADRWGWVQTKHRTWHGQDLRDA